MKITHLGTLVGVAAMSVVSSFGQSRNIQITQDGRANRIFGIHSGLDNTDLAFLKQAAITNIFEIEAAELAKRKSQDPFVMEYAKEMANDHSGSLEEVKQIANQKGVSIPNDLPLALQHKLNQLDALSGAAFDTAYERANRYGHEDASRLFKGEIEKGHDQDVLSYAVKTLPVITMHYKMILTHTTELGPMQMKGGSI